MGMLWHSIAFWSEGEAFAQKHSVTHERRMLGRFAPCVKGRGIARCSVGA